jgi:tetratricopeptide (TPR) repeat protein
MVALAHAEGISDRTLSRLIRWSVIALSVLLVLFGIAYIIGQRVDAGPTLSERQITAAEDAVREAPQQVALRLQLAATYQAAGRDSDAMAQYEEILKALPSNSAALMGRGTLLLEQGDLDAAARAFTKVTAASQKAEFSNIDPQVEAAHYYLGSIAATRGEFPAAEKELQTALSMDGADADALYLLGTVNNSMGAPAKGVQNLRKALLMVPTGWCEPYTALQTSYQKLAQAPEAEYAGAMVDFCQKRPAEATTRLTALTTGPVALDAMLGLGLIAETTSDRDAAARWYTQALAKDPGNPAATTALARLDGTSHAGAAADGSTTKAGK